MVLNEVKNLTPEDLCANVTELFDRIKCQQEANKYPQCAPNVWTLIENAKTLADSIDTALNKYSEILSLNLDVVQDLDKLCGYSRDDLSRYYAQATQDGQEFVSLQDQAKRIESCAGEFEKWLKDLSANDIGQIPDNLDDNLIHDTSTQLEKLEPQRKKLFQSVEKLKSVGPRIYAIGIRHVQFCKNK